MILLTEEISESDWEIEIMKDVLCKWFCRKVYLWLTSGGTSIQLRIEQNDLNTDDELIDVSKGVFENCI